VKSSTKGKRAFGEQAATDATYALTQVIEAGTGSGARLYDRPVAGKTGTTDESAAVWFAGFTPQLATAVNMFRDDNKPVTVNGSTQYGGGYPAQIWRAFMAEAMEGKPVKDFKEPSSYGYSNPYGDYGPGDRYGDRGPGTSVPTPGGTGTPAPGQETPAPSQTSAPGDDGQGDPGEGPDGPDRPDGPGGGNGPGEDQEGGGGGSGEEGSDPAFDGLGRLVGDSRGN